MLKTTRASLPHPVIFVSDVGGGDTPLPDPPQPVVSTRNCISILALPYVDGEAIISLGHLSEIPENGQPAFEALLETPHGGIVVCTSENEVILFDTSGCRQTRIFVWMEDPPWSSKITIGFERADT